MDGFGEHRKGRPRYKGRQTNNTQNDPHTHTPADWRGEVGVGGDVERKVPPVDHAVDRPCRQVRGGPHRVRAEGDDGANGVLAHALLPQAEQRRLQRPRAAHVKVREALGPHQLLQLEGGARGRGWVAADEGAGAHRLVWLGVV